MVLLQSCNKLSTCHSRHISHTMREIAFIGLLGGYLCEGIFLGGQRARGPYSPYKPCNHNLYTGIIIFPHIDNPQSTGYN